MGYFTKLYMIHKKVFFRYVVQKYYFLNKKKNSHLLPYKEVNGSTKQGIKYFKNFHRFCHSYGNVN